MKLPARSLLHAALCFLSAGVPIALHSQASGLFAAYENCRFADDIALVETTPLAQGIEGRTVKTIMGDRNVPLAGGTRLMYGYPHTDFFANVKVERIPAADYRQAKQDLIANFAQILTGDDSSSRNYALKPQMNGLEIYGLDRKKLEGGVLGIYLFFVDRRFTVTTVYFLNQDPAIRKFDNLEDYAKLRDAFLESYTACAAGRAHTASAGSKVQHAVVAAPLPATLPTELVGAYQAAPAVALPEAPLPNGVPVDAAPAVAAQAPASEPGSSKPRAPARKVPAKARSAVKKTSTARTVKKVTPASKTKKKKKR